MITKRVLYAVCMFTAVFLIGCKGRVHRPDIPRALNRTSQHVFYDLSEFTADYGKYQKAVVDNDLDLAKTTRNYIVNRIRVDIEMNYRAYESALFIGRARTDVAWDFLEQGLTFAGTVSNGERVKTVLDAVLSGIKGTRLSVDKNFFREKTVEIIMSKMQASRDRVKNLITEKMSEMTALEYPFEEAWVDLTQFFYAGTLQAGIQALAADAAQDADKAKKETESLDRLRISGGFATATRLDRDNTRLIRSKFNDLFRQNDVATAKKVLKDLGIAIKPGATDKEVWSLLDDQIRAIYKEEGEGDQKITKIDNDQVKKLKTALGIK